MKKIFESCFEFYENLLRDENFLLAGLLYAPFCVLYFIYKYIYLI